MSDLTTKLRGILVFALCAVALTLGASPAGAVGSSLSGTKLRLATGSLDAYTDRVDLAPVGPSVGDIVAFRGVPVTRVASSKAIGFMTGSLRTAAVGFPSPGEVMREVNLVFVLRNGKDQLIIGGAAEYPLDAPTLPQASTTKRPIIGGSGRYAGARGWVVTTHSVTDKWRHTFHFTT